MDVHRAVRRPRDQDPPAGARAHAAGRYGAARHSALRAADAARSAGSARCRIPLDNRPHISRKIETYTGDARGHWEGDTLVVETTNFIEAAAFRGASRNLKLTERFKATGPKTVEWSATLDDSHTWTRPWTFAMDLTRDEKQPVFEYACHEGNYGLESILSAARAEEKKQ